MTIGTREKRPVVFLGPTLPAGEAERVLDATILPPAAQGSIVRAVQRYDPSAILIIDGTFQGEPAVRHKEILWTIDKGILVIGAASMGALRAAELFPHMPGVGLIYRWYRRFAFAPDDAVAVLHGTPEVSSAPFTVAEIDLRMTFRAAEREGLISSGERKRLQEVARRLNFRERTLERIVAEAFPQEIGTRAKTRLDTLKFSLVEQKKHDALLALGLLKNGAFATPPSPPNFVMTAAFARDLDHAGIGID